MQSREIAYLEAVIEDRPQCESLVLVHSETGDEVRLPCDGKRCRICGPEKRRLLIESLVQAFGTLAYVGRVSTRVYNGREWEPTNVLDRLAARARQQRKRYGTPVEYAMIPAPDPTEAIVVSNVPLDDALRFQNLGEWMPRIVDAYRRGVGRIRRSGLVSRVRLAVKGKAVTRRRTGDEPSPWERIPGRIWDDLAELRTEWRRLSRRIRDHASSKPGRDRALLDHSPPVWPVEVL